MKKFRVTAKKTSQPIYISARSKHSLVKRLGDLAYILNVTDQKKG